MNLKIISLNINGLRKKIEIIDTQFTDIDILCLQETKLNNQLILNKLLKNFNEYHFIDHNAMGQKGVSMLFNPKINVKHVEEIVLNNNFGRVCLATIIHNNHEIYIINIYAHHISNIKDTKKIEQKKKFYDELIAIVNKYKNKNLIILGDFNANKNKNEECLNNTYTKPPPGFSDIEIKIYNNFLEKTKLTNLYKYNGIYSFYSQRTKEKFIMFKHNKGLTVDTIMINSSFSTLIKKYHFEIFNKYYQLSDHLPLYLEIIF